MSLQDDINILGLERCDFDDECDRCSNPTGGTWASIMRIPEGNPETDYYICAGCIPAEAVKARAERDYWEHQTDLMGMHTY